MTKAMQMMNTKVQKIQEMKADIDARIKMMLELDAQIKSMKKQYDDAKVDFEATYYQLPNAVAEHIEGNDYYADKTPVLTKKEYDIKALKMMLNNSDAKDEKIIITKTIHIVDEKALKAAIKSGKVAEILVSKTIHGNQSYRTNMAHKS